MKIFPGVCGASNTESVVRFPSLAALIMPNGVIVKELLF